MLNFSWRFLALACLLGASGSAFAQWTSQTLTLRGGWNAVYLEVEPEPRDCDTVFSGLAVESVWKWNRTFSTVQFIQDPGELVPGVPDWLTHLPPSHPARSTRNLFRIQGGNTYLIKLPNGAAATSWTLHGRPVVRRMDWLADSFNLVGLPVAPAGGPTLQSYFATSPAHAGQPVYRLLPSGQWERVSSPATTAVRNGEAIWVYCRGASTYQGPLAIELEQAQGLAYGRLLSEQALVVRNQSAASTELRVRLLPSEPPPNGAVPVKAGEVKLTYYRQDTTNQVFGWFPLSQIALPGVRSNGSWSLRLEADRDGFTPPTAEGLYQSILEVANDQGCRYLVPVTSEGLHSANGGGAGGLQAAGGGSLGARPGLWVGSASIDRVNQPSKINDPNALLATASPFTFRLLVHLDEKGQARLLQKVLQVWKPGTLKTDPEDPQRQVVDKPGEYVLLTDESLASNYEGAALRDGQAVARRFSSPVFAFPQPLPFGGAGPFGAGTISCQVDLGYNDRLNPFKHSFHPDHDNLDNRFEQVLPEGGESFNITRVVELAFQAEDPDHLTLPGWGDNQLGGTYRETITGLHLKPLHVSGTFRLFHSSPVSRLNDTVQ